MRVVPHILLKEGDVIRMPGGWVVIVVGLIEGKLLVKGYNNIFSLPYGFYLNQGGYYIPLETHNASYFHFDNETTYDFASPQSS